MRSKINTKRVVLLVVFLVVAVYGLVRFGHWLYYRYTHAVTEDAFVEADIVNVSPLVPGHIKEFLVDESEKVKKEQLLFVIDDKDYQAQVRLAEARVKATESKLNVLKEKLKQAVYAYELAGKTVREKINAAKHDLEQVRAQFERVSKDYGRFQYSL